MSGSWYSNFTSTIPCITVQLLQFEPTDAHSFVEAATLQHAGSYMLRALLAHHQGAHSCTEQLLNIFRM